MILCAYSDSNDRLTKSASLPPSPSRTTLKRAQQRRQAVTLNHTLAVLRRDDEISYAADNLCERLLTLLGELVCAGGQ